MVTEPYPHYRCTLPSHQDPEVVQTAAIKHFRCVSLESIPEKFLTLQCILCL